MGDESESTLQDKIDQDSNLIELQRILNMIKTHSLAAYSVLLTFVLLTACSLPGAGTGDSVSTPDPGDAGGGGAGTGPCTNPLMPVIAGASWNYQMTGSSSDTFARSILSVGGSAFTDQDVFASGVTRTGEWNCDSGNLIALDPVGGTSATVQTADMNSDFQTNAQSGVTLPASVAAGDAWTQSLSISGTTVVNELTAESTSDTTVSCTALGMESVTVPAGTFDAMKIDCQDSIEITVTISGVTVPTSISFMTTLWFAPSVGMVQSISTGSGVDATIALTSYSIP